MRRTISNSAYLVNIDQIKWRVAGKGRCQPPG